MADPAFKLEPSDTLPSAESPETVSLGSPGPLVRKAAQTIIDTIDDLRGLDIRSLASRPAEVIEAIGEQVTQKCARASLNAAQLDALTSYIGDLAYRYADEQRQAPLSVIVTDKPDTSDFKDYRVFIIDGEGAQLIVKEERHVHPTANGTSSSQSHEIDAFAAFGRRFYVIVGVLSDAAVGRLEAQANAIDRLAAGNSALAEELRQALMDGSLGEEGLTLLDSLSELDSLLTGIEQGQVPEGYESRLAALVESINAAIQEGVQNGTLPPGILQLSANALAALDQAVQGNAELRDGLLNALGAEKLDALGAALKDATATLARNGIVSNQVSLSPAALDALMDLAQGEGLDPELARTIEDLINDGRIAELIDLIGNDAEIAAQIELAASDIAGDILGEVSVAAETARALQQAQQVQALTDAVAAALSEDGTIDALQEAVDNGTLDMSDLPPEVRDALSAALETGDPVSIAQVIAGNGELAAEVSGAVPDIVSPAATKAEIPVNNVIYIAEYFDKQAIGNSADTSGKIIFSFQNKGGPNPGISSRSSFGAAVLSNMTYDKGLIADAEQNIIHEAGYVSGEKSGYLSAENDNIEIYVSGNNDADLFIKIDPTEAKNDYQPMGSDAPGPDIPEPTHPPGCVCPECAGADQGAGEEADLTVDNGDRLDIPTPEESFDIPAPQSE